ncbi:MAG: prepilin peptidase [Rhodococcus sp.]|nr:prepilin peptidase [Rhodococcus sp. (in: high G+C Gram-positive bacteria)]
MGWIQLCGIVWGSGVGFLVGHSARRTASCLVCPYQVREKWCEAAGALICGGVGWWGASHQVTNAGLVTIVGLVALAWWLLVATATDVTARRLPNVLTQPGFAAIVGYGVVTDRVLVPLIGGVLLAVIYAVAIVCAPRSIGAGDVKLAPGVGAAAAFGGGACWLLAALAALVVTAVVGLVVRYRGGSEALPHGASMCGATLLALTIALA